VPQSAGVRIPLRTAFIQILKKSNTERSRRLKNPRDNEHLPKRTARTEEKPAKREPRMIIDGKEITNPLLRTIILVGMGLVALTLLIVLPIVLLGLYNTLAIIFTLVFLSGLVHLILRSAGRRGLIEITRDENEKIYVVTFDVFRSFEKLP
jgi:hypothetical protein